MVMRKILIDCLLSWILIKCLLALELPGGDDKILIDYLLSLESLSGGGTDIDWY